jgi:hypothetical protein
MAAHALPAGQCPVDCTCEPDENGSCESPARESSETAFETTLTATTPHNGTCDEVEIVFED